MLRVVRSGRVTISSLQAWLHISRVTGTLSLEFAGLSSVNTRPSIHQKFSSACLGSGHMFSSAESPHLCWNLHCRFQESAVLGFSLALCNQTAGLCIYLAFVFYFYSVSLKWSSPCSSIRITVCSLEVSLKTEVLITHTYLFPLQCPFSSLICSTLRLVR